MSDIELRIRFKAEKVEEKIRLISKLIRSMIKHINTPDPTNKNKEISII